MGLRIVLTVEEQIDQARKDDSFRERLERGMRERQEMLDRLSRESGPGRPFF